MAKKYSIATAVALTVLSLSSHAFASNTSAAHGHHGGNNGALGSSVGMGSAQGSSAAGQSGMGGSYWAPKPNASAVDAYQPYPQSEMRQFQKP